VIKRAPKLSRSSLLLVNLSGRGDKDVESVLRYQREHPRRASGRSQLEVVRGGSDEKLPEEEGSQS